MHCLLGPSVASTEFQICYSVQSLAIHSVIATVSSPDQITAPSTVLNNKYQNSHSKYNI